LAAIDSLKLDNGQWPDKIIFSGEIGKQVYMLVINEGWEFNTTVEMKPNSKENRVFILYSKKKTKHESWHGITLGEKLDGKVIKGIPSDDMMGKLMDAYYQPAYKKETWEHPTLEIELIRI
jgi:hypothetical protein